MSQRARIAIIAIAAVGLVLAFFAARGGEESDDPPARPAATQTGPPDDGGVTAPSEITTTPSEPETVPVVQVTGGKPKGGVQDLDFEQGERVRFVVQSDVADEVHVHGYDVSKDVDAGKPATFSFKADITGRFEVELEQRGVEIASLRVSP